MVSTTEAGIVPDLSGVSKTMLWSLYNRATEAARPDGILTDPVSVHIQNSIDHDFKRDFGIPAGTLAVRAAAIDAVLKNWISTHPDGLVVSLGEGLETQRHRVDNGRVRWLSVDLPDAITLRERFLPPTDRFHHLGISVLDPAWMDAVDPSAGVMIVAQGLLMYLPPSRLRTLFSGIAGRFPTAQIVFDVVPRWFSRLTLLGLNQTPHYRLPPMPWGINRNELEPVLRTWLPEIGSVTFLDYQMPRGLPDLMFNLPFTRPELPTLVHVVLGRDASASNKTALRKKPMTSLNGVMEVATQNASSSSAMAISAGQIIAKRVALGVAAAFDPMGADHAEFNRMVPEKMEAFSAAGMIMMSQASKAGEQITRLASDAIASVTRASIAMATSKNPVAFAETQRNFVTTWMEQATAGFMAMGMIALGAQQAAMVPIQATMDANTERLG